MPNIPDRIHICSALVDTGADKTCISNSVAEELKLEPSGKTEMHSASEVAEVNVYDIRPVLILSAMTDLEGNLQGGDFVVFDPVSAPEFVSKGKPYAALIGRDVLSLGILTMSFDGHYTFSF